MCWVMPPASPAATSVWRIASSSEVLPWSTWPMIVTTGGRVTSSSSAILVGGLVRDLVGGVLDLDLLVEAVGQHLDRLVGEGLGEGGHLAELHQLLDHLAGGEAERLGHLLDGGAGLDLGDLDLRRLLGLRREVGLDPRGAAPAAAAARRGLLLGRRPRGTARGLRVDHHAAAASASAAASTPRPCPGAAAAGRRGAGGPAPRCRCGRSRLRRGCRRGRLGRGRRPRRRCRPPGRGAVEGARRCRSRRRWKRRPSRRSRRPGAWRAPPCWGCPAPSLFRGLSSSPFLYKSRSSPVNRHPAL